MWSCANKSKNENADVYDITKILTNTADNIIIPQLENHNNSTKELEAALTEYNSDPTLDKLNSLRSKFKDSYISWQKCSFINFGNSNFEKLNESLNNFPVTDLSQKTIDTYPDKGNDFEEDEYKAAKAYPAFDYVLFKGEDSEIISNLSDKHKDFCSKNIDYIKSKSEEAYLFWKNNTDGFYSKFKSDDTKTTTSAFTKYVNAFCKDIEVLKNAQLKAPGGQEFYILPVPGESEALYSGYSLDLMKSHLENLERIYKGEDISGNNGIGFDDYLISLGTKRKIGDDGVEEDLNELILTTFTTIEEKLNALNGSINEAAQNQKETVNELYSNVKKLVGFTKTDMAFAFGVNINYADPQDGD